MERLLHLDQYNVNKLTKRLVKVNYIEKRSMAIFHYHVYGMKQDNEKLLISLNNHILMNMNTMYIPLWLNITKIIKNTYLKTYKYICMHQCPSG